MIFRSTCCNDWSGNLGISTNGTTWNYMALVKSVNENQAYRFYYRDGELKRTLGPSQNNLYGNSDTKTRLWIGGYSYKENIACYPFFDSYSPFYGLIDEVRIYNRALSDSEIKALYEATK